MRLQESYLVHRVDSTVPVHYIPNVCIQHVEMDMVRWKKDNSPVHGVLNLLVESSWGHICLGKALGNVGRCSNDPVKIGKSNDVGT